MKIILPVTGEIPSTSQETCRTRNLRTPNPGFSSCFLGLVLALPSVSSSFPGDSPPVPREGAVESDEIQNLEASPCLLSGSQQEFKLEFQLAEGAGSSKQEASNKAEASGPHTGLTDQTFSAKLFQKQDSAQTPNQWGLHSLLCKVRWSVGWPLKSDSALYTSKPFPTFIPLFNF